MNNTTKHILVGAAVASIIGVTVPVTAHAKGGKTFKCEGVNTCKHKSACKGGENNSCKHKNACKGKGMVMTTDQAECDAMKAKAGGGAPAADTNKAAPPSDAK
jgi:hypothetical protein